MAVSPLHILLVDDDPDDLLLFKEAIASFEIRSELLLFACGEAFIAHLNATDTIPDLIFLDMKMPKIDGLECLRQIRKTPEWQDAIVAIYSNFTAEDLIENTFSEGANIYIEKPEDLQKLKKVLKKVLQVNWQYHTSNLNRSNFLLRT
ncbi:response regulator [Pricia sp. S334]|uniref:Response regulator n=1 Tax=Pricia mediterranea TaxID=3076079 RepID=A0ABU3L1G4_9FLAO|nr:response regulator [Pricia sp. S334]MDT7827571.1 response regulator [Pricia sp. S334]